jgi:Fur family peroxide stress response transcriptional regulator
MKTVSHKSVCLLENALNKRGLRSTPQRTHVFQTLLERTDHPTADEIYLYAKKSMSNISLATVYNCLETLVECNLVKQVNLDRASSRYCPNLEEHAHFHCKDTGAVHDIELPAHILSKLAEILPQGYQAQSIELTFSGTIQH